MKINNTLDQSLEGQDPSLVWKIFDQLRQIPRPSGKEHAAMEWVVEFAEKHSLNFKRDSKGNVCVFAPATSGFEDLPAVCLQSHIDMVTERSSESIHNFDTDPIQLRRDGEWLSANDTTLGADNGIGLSMSLAAAIDPNFQHPALEILITVEEETGLYGAFAFSPSELGMTAKTVINLDNEQLGKVYVSSAGLQIINASQIIERENQPTPDQIRLELKLKDLPGGHSGAQIHEHDRENAIKGMMHALAPYNFKLVSINAGDKDNAIPRDITLVVEVAPEVAIEIESNALTTKHNYGVEVKRISGAMSVEAYTQEFSDKVRSALEGLTHGVVRMHNTIPNLVATSANLASVKEVDDRLRIVLSVRSCVTDEIEEIVIDSSKLLTDIGYDIQLGKLIPGWNGNPEDEVVKLTLNAYKDITGNDATIEAIHAGLETGIITDALARHLGGYVQSVSFGPTIEEAHTPQEKVNITDTNTTYLQLGQLLASLK